MQSFVFLDTNIFLHYQDFVQINWLVVVAAERVTIVLSPVTIRELNMQKDSSLYDKKIRARAGKTLIKLHKLFSTDLQAKVTEEVDIYFEDRDPLVDFSANQLNQEIKDDHLIASIIMYREEKPDAQMILVTSDSGLTLMAKAKRHGIRTVKLDDKYRLKEEPDPDQKKIKELQQELDKVKHTIPKLSLCFAGGNQNVKFILQKPTECIESEIETKVTELRSNFPKLAEKTKGNSERKGIRASELTGLSSLILADVMWGVSGEDIVKYNTELEKFFEKYYTYLKKQSQYDNLAKMIIQLDIVLENNGTSPGEDIDIFLHFPDGFILQDEMPTAPIAPEPLLQPKSPLEKLQTSPELWIPGVDYGLRSNLQSIQSINTAANVSAPHIKKTNSYEVNVHVQNIKHGLLEELDSLYVLFPSFEEAKSFTVDYHIFAANVPNKIIGNLNIAIEKEK